MRAQNLKNWPKDLTSVEGILYFAEMWEEMLFDYTLDSYKMRSFNLPSLCSEMIGACNQAEKGVLVWRAITPLRDEILWHLDHDDTAKGLLGAALQSLRKRIHDWQAESPHADLSHACSYIIQQLQATYYPQLLSSLRAVISDGNKKKDIQRIGSSLLTELVRRGFSAPFIFHRLKTIFFKGNLVTGQPEFDLFFARFDEPERVYTVVCRAPSRGSLLSVKLKPEFMEFVQKLPDLLPLSRAAQKCFEDDVINDGYLVFKDVLSMDQFGARKEALKRLEMVGSVVRFVLHQLNDHECTESSWLIYERLNNEEPISSAYVVDPPRNISYRRPDVPQDRVGDSLTGILRPFVNGRCDEQSREQLTSALNAHSAAVKSPLTDNCFMNLWRGYETLTGTTADRDTIQTIIRCSVPLLCRKYFLKHAKDLIKNLRRCLFKEWKEALENRGETESKPEFLARVLVSDEMVEIKDRLFDAAANNPLLRNRLFTVQQMLLSAKTSRALLKEHELRLRWNIQRIYRVRNSIIHGSRSYPWLELLSENLHDYFDHVFQELVEIIVSQPHHQTLEMAFFEADTKYSAYTATLERMKPEMGKLDVARQILFGGC